MDQTTSLVFIENTPKDPVEMFTNLLTTYKTTNPDKAFIPMEMATIDDEFGVLNRTLVYRGLDDDGHIIFVTEKNSKKYANLSKDPRTSVSFLFEIAESNGTYSLWQIRVFGKAEELSPKQLPKLWTEEPIYAKIRSRINECGKPLDFAKHKDDFKKLLKEHENGQDSLLQTETYTAFKVIPTVWDFYKSQLNSVADRVQYRKGQSDGEKWSIMHVAT